MPKHYALGENVQHKTVYFNNTKTVKVTYDKPFLIKPNIQISLSDKGELIAYKKKITKTYVKVAFKDKWTGDIDLLIIERQ